MEKKHEYPSGYEPPDGDLLPPYGNDAWEILDTLAPGVLTETQRNLLCGMIAGRIEKCVDDALAGKPKPQAGKLRRGRF